MYQFISFHYELAPFSNVFTASRLCHGLGNFLYVPFVAKVVVLWRIHGIFVRKYANKFFGSLINPIFCHLDKLPVHMK